jgi:hypothetical protein
VDTGSVPVPAAGSGRIKRVTSTRWRVEAGPPGWVTLPEEWSPGWQLDGEQGHPTVAGTVAIQVGAGPAVIEYAPWHLLRLGLAASLVSLAAIVVAGLVEHRRDLRGWWARRSRWQLMDLED